MKNWFKQKPKYRITIMFYMKSGAVIYARCDNIKIQKSGNDLVGYEMEGNAKEDTLYFRLDDISAIQFYEN